MACDKCLELKGDSTTYYSDFAKIFGVIDFTATTMTELGTAECKNCHQQIKFDYDETLIPKLRVEFVSN